MTTKQEALEALLTKMREWEQPHEETRATEPGDVVTECRKALARLLDDATITHEQERQAWVVIGAAALYLLTDEVTVVAGRTLDEWIANRAGCSTGTGPQPINGVIGRVRDA